jgi:hypothetical protein
MSDSRLGVGAASYQTSYTTDLWLRRASLVVSAGSATDFSSDIGASSQGEDLSRLRFTFYIRAADGASTPKTATIRVYNLSEQTRKRVIQEYSRVTLSAGYKTGRFAIIFDGTIKQFRRGRENNIDSYLDIFAADGDLAHLYAIVNKTIEGPATTQQQVDVVNGAIAAYGIEKGEQTLKASPGEASGTGGILPRGKVLYGMFVGRMRDFANNNSVGWLIEDGKLKIIPNNGVAKGTAIQLNSRTGMIGVPEATDQGIMVRSLLNPVVKVYDQVQINNKDINQTIQQGAESSGPNPNSTTFPGYTNLTRFADVTNDGFYRVLVVEHEGDSRGNPWYTNMVLLALDPSTTGGPTPTDLKTPLPPGEKVPDPPGTVTVEDIDIK